LQVVTRDRGHAFEGAIALAEIAKVIRIQGKLRLRVAVEVNAHQAVGMRIGKRLQQDALNDAENGAVRADAEGQSQHDNDGESGSAGQGSHGVSQVVPDGLDIIGAAHITHDTGDPVRGYDFFVTCLLERRSEPGR
jgi:hypothetical protein